MRCFKNLNSLNLDGNPFCQDARYRPFTISHLPTLVYLDYRLVDDQMREAANEDNNNKYLVEAMMQDEAAALKKQEEVAVKEAKYQLHKVIIICHQSRSKLLLTNRGAGSSLKWLKKDTFSIIIKIMNY